MTIRLWALGMELSTVILWIHLVNAAKYQWVKSDDRFPFKLAGWVIILFCTSMIVTTVTGMMNHRPINSATFTPIISTMFGILAGVALAIVFHAKMISNRPHVNYIPAWHPEHTQHHSNGVRR